jgi:beta-lactamase regulating signal transducer with metallopeptidase domain
MFSASGSLSSVLGWTMLHLLWVIIVLYGLHRALQFFLRRFADSIRYVAACAMLGVIAFVSIAMLSLPWLLQYDLPFVPQLRAIAQATGLGVVDTELGGHDPVYFEPFTIHDRSTLRAWAARVEPVLSWLGVIWGIGFVWRLLPSLRDGVGLIWVVSRASPSGIDLTDSAYATIRGIVHGRAYPVLESAYVDGPCVAGWLKPVILLPLGLATQIRPDLLICILSHELAHIRRRDFAVNLLQIGTEAFLFFHPCVKWLSEEIRILREACCDDTAIVATGSSKTFAESLIAFENLRPNLRLAMGMSDASIPSRVDRLVVLKYQTPRNGYRRFFTLLLSVVMLLMIGAMPVSGIADDYRDQLTVAEEGFARTVLSEMGLRRDNPDLWPALQQFGRVTTTYRTIAPEQLVDLVEVASRGATEDQVLRARLPYLRLEMTPAYDSPDVVSPTDVQIGHIAAAIFFHVRELPPGEKRDKWMRAAVVLGAQQGWETLPRLRTMVQHVRFEELSDCASDVVTRFRRLTAIETMFNFAATQAVWAAVDEDPERLPLLIDRFTQPISQRRYIAAAAAHSVPLGSAARIEVASKLRSTGLHYDAKLAELVEQPLTGVRAYVGRFDNRIPGPKTPRRPEPVPITEPVE